MKRRLWPCSKFHIPPSTKVLLQESQIKLKTYTGEALKIIGQALVKETYQDQTTKLPLQILKGSRPGLFRRNWLQNIKLNWGPIKKITCDLDSILSRHQSIFKDELSTISGIKTKFFVKPESKLKFFKLCQVPYALKEPLNKN